MNAPHPIRTAKLSTVEPNQYYGRGLRGNLGCCMAKDLFSNFCNSVAKSARNTRIGMRISGACSTRVVFVPSKDKIRVRVPASAQFSGGLLYMVAYNLRKVENRDRYPDPPSNRRHSLGVMTPACGAGSLGATPSGGFCAFYFLRFEFKNSKKM